MFIKVGPRLLLHVFLMLWINVASCIPMARSLLEISKPRCNLGTPFLKHRLRRGAPRPQGLWNRPHLWRSQRVGGQAWAVRTRRKNVSYFSHSCFTGYFPVESTRQTSSSECGVDNVHRFKQSGCHVSTNFDIRPCRAVMMVYDFL